MERETERGGGCRSMLFSIIYVYRCEFHNYIILVWKLYCIRHYEAYTSTGDT